MSWFMESSEPEYLDGIQSGVTVFAENRRPVAYAFSEPEGQIMAAAPDVIRELLDLIEWLEVNERTIDGEFLMDELLAGPRAAIAKATQSTPIMGEDA